jgi:hypothetical protein
MVFPKPEIGLVISFSYLWREEAEQGHLEGKKARPCAIVLAQIEDTERRQQVVVVPVTHSPPTNPDRAVEIPPRVKRHLGLDDEQSWILLDDFNVFTWPGFDLRPVPGSDRYDYGLLPPMFFEQLRKKFIELVKSGLASETGRDEIGD